MKRRLGSTASARAREMRGLLEEWERSGLTLTEFGRKRGVRPSTLSWWRYVFRHAGRRRDDRVELSGRGRIGGARSGGPRQLFVEVKLAGTELGSATAPLLEVVLRGGQVIRVPGQFDPATLRAIVFALDSPC
jgi:hypothetical protein